MSVPSIPLCGGRQEEEIQRTERTADVDWLELDLKDTRRSVVDTCVATSW